MWATTAWKVSKYGVFSGPYSVRMRENTDQEKLRIWTFFMQWTVCSVATPLKLKTICRVKASFQKKNGTKKTRVFGLHRSFDPLCALYRFLICVTFDGKCFLGYFSFYKIENQYRLKFFKIHFHASLISTEESLVVSAYLNIIFLRCVGKSLATGIWYENLLRKDFC